MTIFNRISKLKGLYVAASFFVAINLVALVYALNSAESFRSSVTILPVTGAEGGSGLESSLGSLGGLASSFGVSLLGSSATEVKGEALLRSADTIIGFINEYELSSVILRSRDNVDFDSRMVKYFRENHISITKNLRAGTTMVTLTWPDRGQVGDLANSYVDYVNRIYAERETSHVESRLAFLEGEINKVAEREIKEALYRMVEIELQKKTRINTSPAYAFEIIESAQAPYRLAWPRRGFIMISSFIISVTLILAGLALRNLRFKYEV